MEVLPKRTKDSEHGELKVVIMSATLDAQKFQEYFHGAPLLKVPGRTHPVEVFYTSKPEPNYVEAAIRTVVHIHQCEGPGDILVFLTGEQEIEQACEEIREKAGALGKDLPELVVYPLYASLPPQQQRKIFDRAPGPRVVGGPPGRKVVVSTNIAETSLTIGKWNDEICVWLFGSFCRLIFHSFSSFLLLSDRRHSICGGSRIFKAEGVHSAHSSGVSLGVADQSSQCTTASRSCGSYTTGKVFSLVHGRELP